MGSVQLFKVRANQQVARATYLLELDGDTTGIDRPGQFVNVEVPGFYLRRPFSVCSWEPGRLTLLYKVLGSGTEELTHVSAGDTLNVLSGLGNGFWLPARVNNPLLVGGGIGVAPMLGLAETLVSEGVTPHVILGFGSADEVALAEELRELGLAVTISTVDGSEGVPGFVTDAMSALQGEGASWDYLYACGPTPMLKAVFAAADSPGQYSMEERMACGFGACMGCVTETDSGLQRICKEGPVFESSELPW